MGADLMAERPRRRRRDDDRRRRRDPDRRRPKPKPRPPRMDERERDAYERFVRLLERFGFKHNGEIAREVRAMVLEGETSFEAIQLGLMDTDAWKRRFKGNELLRKGGHNVLSVAEYLSYENQASELMKAAGLPAGFFDQPSDFAEWIGGRVSVSELDRRITMASDLMNRSDRNVLDELERRGLTRGEILAHYLDAERALPILQKRYQSALIGAAARRAGVTADIGLSNRLAELGVTEDAAGQGFGTVGAITPGLSGLADISGEKYSQSDAEKEVFFNDADARRKREKLTAAEEAAFGGSSGVGQNSLGSSSAGAF